MLVDMAGSENIEAAGQTGLEAKMQVNFIFFIMQIANKLVYNLRRQYIPLFLLVPLCSSYHVALGFLNLISLSHSVSVASI